MVLAFLGLRLGQSKSSIMKLLADDIEPIDSVLVHNRLLHKPIRQSAICLGMHGAAYLFRANLIGRAATAIRDIVGNSISIRFG